MAIAIQESIATAVDTPAGSATSTSWTPGSNELCLCLIAIRAANTPANSISSVTGNGLTWVKILEKDDTQNAICLSTWRAMGASPSAGGVTVNFGVDPLAVSFQIIRISGVDTTGTNGSGAIGATNSADTGATDTANASISVTTTRANSRVIGFGSTRNSAWTVGSGCTAILINQAAGSGGNISRSQSEYKDQATSGTSTTVDWTHAANDWVLAALEILSPSGTAYNQAASGTMTSSGAIVKKPTKILTGTLTSAGALLRELIRALAGTLTSSGALTALKLTVKTLAGTLTSAGALVKKPIKPLAGTLTSSGALLKRANKILVGTLTSSGVLTKVKAVIKVLAGTLTSSGALTRRTIKALAGTLTSSGVTLALRLGGILLTLPERARSLTVKAKQGLTVSVRNLLTLERK